MRFSTKLKKLRRTIIFSVPIMIVGLSLFFVFTDNFTFSKNLFSLSSQIKQLNGVYEPSAAQQLESGSIVVLEDEISRALSLLEFDSDENLLEDAIQDKQLNAALKESFDDLEGIALSNGSVIYATTSFSRTSKGKQRANREKLLRLAFDENGGLLKKDVYTKFAASIEKSEFFNTLKSQDDDVEIDDINIEGLSFNKDKSRLLFGFKEPLVNDLSIIIQLENPQQVLDGSELPVISSEATLLDLQGGGIRSLYFDDRLEGYLIANEVNFGGGPKQSQLWFWDGQKQQAPIALSLPEIADMENIEAIAAVTVGSERKILLMSDDGSRKNKRSAHYALIEYTEIESQVAPQ